MLSLNSVMIGTLQPKVLAEYYEKILGKKPDWADGDWAGWQIGSCNLSIGSHSEMKGKQKDPGRVMFNFETKEVKEEFERMKKAGAIVIKEPYEMGGGWIATLADPDDNYFQLVTPWKGMDTKN